MKKVAVIGASGYTGLELIRLLNNHKQVEITALTANKHAGKRITDIYPHLAVLDLPVLQKVEDVDFSDIDIAFCCLPHGTTQEIISSLLSAKEVKEGSSIVAPPPQPSPLKGEGATSRQDLKIIDLSADFRLNNIETYNAWYREHTALELQKEAVYGLCELYREKIKNARLIANPGCYPTSILLPLIPLVREGAIEKNIIADSKTGLTGAGRTLKEGFLFCEANENTYAYGIGSHRHSPEIEEKLADFGGKPEVTFTPHVVPMNRGILSTIYVNLNSDITKAKNILEEQYKNEPFVKVLEGNTYPKTAMVQGSNYCVMNIFQGKGNQAVIVSAIDNLVKGASGQAVHNMNIMFGFDEKEGIEGIGEFI